MLDSYKVVCNTAAGRRRYMQYLIPFVLASNIVDRYDIWVNTMDKQDIEFFQILSKKFPKINLVYQPDGIINGAASINAFFRNCIDDNVIYFRFDDDIVWMEPDAIEKMVRFRIDNPSYFLVSPLVINNALCTYILQNTHKIRLDRYYPAVACEDTLWRCGDFAVQLHNWFLKTQLPNKQYQNLYCGAHPMAMTRFSINSILWFGSEMKKFEGIVLGDEEEWLSVVKPTELGAVNCFNGDAVISHFAFFTQRKKLDSLNILQQYGEYLHKEWQQDMVLRAIDQAIQEAMHEVEERKAEIMDMPDIYNSLTTPPHICKKIKNKISCWKIPMIELRPLWQIKRGIQAKQRKYID
jgi:hypothetical protein